MAIKALRREPAEAAYARIAPAYTYDAETGALHKLGPQKGLNQQLGPITKPFSVQCDPEYRYGRVTIQPAKLIWFKLFGILPFRITYLDGNKQNLALENLDSPPHPNDILCGEGEYPAHIRSARRQKEAAHV